MFQKGEGGEMTKKNQEWKGGGKYHYQISVKLTKEQKEHLLAFPSQAEIVRYLIDKHMRDTA